MKNCVEEAVLFCSHSTWKSLRLQRACHNEHFIHSRIKFVLAGFFCFHYLWQLLLWSLVIKGKNVLSSKIKSRKKYWISHKNNNVTCVIGWFFIILFSFSLSFICISFMFAVGSCNFGAQENLKCVKQQGLLIDIKHHKILILFIIPRETLCSPKTYCIEKICDWKLNKSAPLPHKFWEIWKIS